MIDKEKLDPAAREFEKNSVFTQFAKGYDEVLEQVSEDAKTTREILTENIKAEERSNKGEKLKIIVSNEDPALNPLSPDFDIKAYKTALATAGGMEALKETLQSGLKSVALAQPIQETFSKTIDTATIMKNLDTLRDVAQSIVTTTQFALDGLYTLVASETYKNIKESIDAIAETLRQRREELAALDEASQAVKDLSPYIEQELEAMEGDPRIEGITFAEFIRQGYDENGNPTGSLFQTVLERAKKRAQKDKRNHAIEKGALLTIGSRIASYSAIGYEDALNIPRVCSLPNNDNVSKIFDKRGKLNLLVFDEKNLVPLTKLHTAMLMALNQIVLTAGNELDPGTGWLISVYLPDFCREIGLDPRETSKKRQKSNNTDLSLKRLSAVLELLRPLENYIGRTPDGQLWRLVSFQGYSPESDTITFSAPYLYELRKTEALQNCALNRLLHANVVNEPNWAAVELANRILNGLLQRGSTADYRTYKTPARKKKETKRITRDDGTKETITTEYDSDTLPPPPIEPIVTYQIRFNSLIDACPQFKQALSDIPDEYKVDPKTGKRINKKSNLYNAKIRNTFNTAIRIIKQKSDAPEYFIDMDFLPKHPKTGEFLPPTKRTLSTYFKITHKGKNKNFRLE